MAKPQESHQESVPFYPDHVSTELKVVAGLLLVAVLVGALGALFPIGLGAPADPMDTPEHVKPEWYFLALYQLLKFMPKTAGAVAPVIALLLVALWPFISRKQDTSKRAAHTRLIFVVALLILLAALTVWGEVS